MRLALARLSWTPKIDGRAVETAEEELLTDEQMIQLFDLADCQKSAARFDMDKLQWLNQKLIQRSTGRNWSRICVPSCPQPGIRNRIFGRPRPSRPRRRANH